MDQERDLALNRLNQLEEVARQLRQLKSEELTLKMHLIDYAAKRGMINCLSLNIARFTRAIK